jgi:hypothetical protein
MKKKRKKVIKEFAKTTDRMWQFTTLKRNKREDNFEASLNFDNYRDLIYTVSDLLEISMHALYHNGDDNSGEIAEPSHAVINVLKIAFQLLPVNEFEVLDNCHELYLKLDGIKKA